MVRITPHFTLSTHERKLRCLAVGNLFGGMCLTAGEMWKHSVDMARLPHAVQGDYGPFKASFPVDVPLWMAIYLHQRKQCRIHLPDWLNAEHLQGAIRAE